MNDLQKFILNLLKNSKNTSYNQKFIENAFNSKMSVTQFLIEISKNINESGTKASEIAKKLVLTDKVLTNYERNFLKNNLTSSQISRIKNQKDLDRILNKTFDKYNSKINYVTKKYKDRIEQKSNGYFTFSYDISKINPIEFRTLSEKQKISVITQYKNFLDKFKNIKSFSSNFDKFIVRKVIYERGIGLVPVGYNNEAGFFKATKDLQKYLKSKETWTAWEENWERPDLVLTFKKRFRINVKQTKKQKRLSLKNFVKNQFNVIKKVTKNTFSNKVVKLIKRRKK